MGFEIIQCSSCGSNSSFLRKKAHAIGLYCLGCGKWHKWVGKKDINNYKHRGYEVHEESYIPETVKTESNENAHLAEYGKPLGESVMSYDEAHVPQSVFRDTDNSGRRQHIGVTTQEPVKDEIVTIEELQRHSAPDPSTYSNFDKCQVCMTGVLDPVRDDDDVALSIFEGVMFLRTKDNGELYGSFNISHCPGCGKKL